MNKFVTLLVEDDMLQREVLADVLKGDRFEVVECSTAQAAELVIATSGTEQNCAPLIADQNLEGKMVGSELASYARWEFPDLHIVIMSGLQMPPLPPRAMFLQKPFLPTKLLEVVRSKA
jgi:DNA-binding NtrC family response regulator